MKVSQGTTSTRDLHQYLLGAISPRPIALVSTISDSGLYNLAPFSFFNVFSANPPIVIFSPANSGRSGATKNTLENLKEVPECVINIVNYNMVNKVNIAGCPFPKGVNEFEKAGFESLPSDIVKPLRVKEAPVQMECKVKQIIELGKEGGAGNLVIAEVVLMHIDDNILDAKKMIDPFKIDLIGRMNANWYCRVNGDAIFEIPKLDSEIVVGMDCIPEYARKNPILEDSDLIALATANGVPTENEVKDFSNANLLSLKNLTLEKKYGTLCAQAKELIKNKRVQDAWKTLLSIHYIKD